MSSRLVLMGAVITAAIVGACSDDTASNGATGQGAAGQGGAGAAGPGSGAGPAGPGSGAASACGSDTPAAFAGCVEQSRYLDDLTTVEGNRPPGSPHHQQVQDLCASRFEQHGFTVERHDYGGGVNVIGVLPGVNDDRIIVSAHYDSTDNCPGADDNGTGVAGVLETARVLSAGSFSNTLVVACWDEEERGLIGAEAYAARAVQTGESIIGVYVYEMIGYIDTSPNTQELPLGLDIFFPDEAAEVEANDFRGDFLAVIGDESFQTGIDLLDQNAEAQGLKSITLTLAADQKTNNLFNQLRRSDHAPFWDRDIPALHMTDTSEFRYEPYHCANGQDVKENLNHGFSTSVIRATVAATAELLGIQ